jgi:hypothetical protein
MSGQCLPFVRLSQALLTQNVGFLRQRRGQGIEPQMIMIIKILVPQGQPHYSLTNQTLQAVFDIARIAPVNKTVRELSQYPGAKFHFPQKESTLEKATTGRYTLFLKWRL